MRVGVAITKRVNFRGINEEFSNVYHYDVPAITALALNETDLIIDRLVALEKAVHSSGVSFATARVWETGGTPAENETLRIRDLSGSGTLGSTYTFYKELAVVVNLYTGRSSTTGRRVYLRKYIRAGALPSGSPSIGLGQAALTATDKAPFITYGEAIRKLEVAGFPTDIHLEAPGGQNLAANAQVTVLDWLHVRQFRWTGKRH